MSISPSVCLSVSVISPFSLILWWKQLCMECFIPGNLEIMSPYDWHSLKLLPSCFCETLYILLSLSLSCSVIFIAQTTCSQTFIKPSLVFCLPPLPFSPASDQPPSHSLRVSWRRWLRTSEASSVETPASPIPTWRERPSLMACSLLVV